MTSIRPTAVAGTFYPGSARELAAAVKGFLAPSAGDAAGDGPVPKAIVVPHAGYVYSGAVAGTAYARLKPAHRTITRVVLLGPCHRVALRGLALSGADFFATPLGNIPLDRAAADALLKLPQIQVFDETHAQEHSLEVQLPFLQEILDDFTLVPLVVGEASEGEVAEVLETLWGGDETLIVISSDLSHYLDYDRARALDHKTRQAIETLDASAIGREQACGRVPLRGLLGVAKRKGMIVATTDMRNSGDTAGSRDKVVGYGAWLFLEGGARDAKAEDSFAGATKKLISEHGATLLRLAAASIEHGLKKGQALTIDRGRIAPELFEHGASFITLKRNGNLRGCIGTAQAHRALAVDVAGNGYAAAFKDSRFPALAAKELDGLSLSVSVLSSPQAIAASGEDALLAQLRPGIDGLIIEDKGRRALFLPSVWEALPAAEKFLGHLKAKAGLSKAPLSAKFKSWRFITESVSMEDAEMADVSWGSNLV